MGDVGEYRLPRPPAAMCLHGDRDTVVGDHSKTPSPRQAQTNTDSTNILVRSCTGADSGDPLVPRFVMVAGLASSLLLGRDKPQTMARMINTRRDLPPQK
ncbi:hypothetical protein MTP99_010198 [Tenebrio molitor]|jgi:hypothetical protein|nr:hypothetical protein MTP99_010198 [Tenebrio molitor]